MFLGKEAPYFTPHRRTVWLAATPMEATPTWEAWTCLGRSRREEWSPSCFCPNCYTPSNWAALMAEGPAEASKQGKDTLQVNRTKDNLRGKWAKGRTCYRRGRQGGGHMEAGCGHLTLFLLPSAPPPLPPESPDARLWAEGCVQKVSSFFLQRLREELLSLLTGGQTGESVTCFFSSFEVF